MQKVNQGSSNIIDKDCKNNNSQSEAESDISDGEEEESATCPFRFNYYTQVIVKDACVNKYHRVLGRALHKQKFQIKKILNLMD